jgi:hypothetical protein
MCCGRKQALIVLFGRVEPGDRSTAASTADPS